ncbi:hypothetical protein [Kerstersia gyiorum]|uniref:hypothetical protein n=1 Tax=Kerstersia gyiorum TaxID=206506 RepID=UPI0020A1D0D1|nr:hypothetical protein [Kerstersia gyiorum]MCP1633005.1 hypothetical protein [Kerstersia gyiorum]MCP1636545.1 hypothetical protein [Kerstersia gyiorum]MCP1670202.1 hypothetical protein [Kerstersia gyiorum]MCP1682526.1 hypothetical protein [Kerstersia gyiorum]MCP1712597.1 hypothetical protein [Kerstersia gyiorum]
MNKFEFRLSTGQDLPRVMEIWRSAVDATHDFLAPADRAAIEAELLAFLPQVSFLLAAGCCGHASGFHVSARWPSGSAIHRTGPARPGDGQGRYRGVRAASQ